MVGKQIRSGRGEQVKIHDWKELDGLENKDYIVEDGDVMHFLFNV